MSIISLVYLLSMLVAFALFVVAHCSLGRHSGPKQSPRHHDRP
jgi:hypothetical protein